MARAVRIERAGGWYHVTARGNERRAIYRDPRDRQHFCALLGGTAEAFRRVLHAFVLMGSHYHLLVETPEPNLSRAMQWLNVSYTAGKRFEQRLFKVPRRSRALAEARAALESKQP